jgi:hypothetical protein
MVRDADDGLHLFAEFLSVEIPDVQGREQREVIVRPIINILGCMAWH